MKSHSKSTFHIFTLFALLASLLGSALIVTPVHAAGITVDTTDDELNGDGDCSLREAIQAANTNIVVDACTAGFGADTITLPAGTYTLTIPGVGENFNLMGDLDIRQALTINGAGAGTTVIQAGASPGSGIDRVFDVIGTIPVGISDVTIANGVCTSCNGGGILNGGTLTVTSSTFSGNSAFVGGGISNAGTLTVTNSTFSGNSADGGGIYNVGILTVTNSTFSGNTAISAGGGISNDNPGTLTVTNSTFSGDSAQFGGGIFNDGTVTVTNSTFSGNSALYGGGIYNYYAPITVNNSILANSSGGMTDCYNPLGTVNGTNNLIEMDGSGGNPCGTTAPINSDPGLGALADNGGPNQTFALLPGSPAIGAGDDARCAATVGSPNYGAGGLDQRGIARPAAGCDIGALESNAQPGPTFNVNTAEDSLDGACDAYVAGITDCTVRDAITAANTLAGADIITFGVSGTITLGSTLPIITDAAGLTMDGTGQVVTISGGGAVLVLKVDPGASLTLNKLTIANGYSYDRSGVGSTGGISNYGTLAVTNSIFSGNVADTYGGGGGGIMNAGGTLTITNSTFSGNINLAGFGGGAILNLGGTLTVTNSTFSGNSGNGGGIYNDSTSTTTVTKSTFVANVAAGSIGGGIRNYSGTLTIANSTFSGNFASIGGGGIYNEDTTTITNSTFSGNSAATGSGIDNFGGTVTLRNTIVANSVSGGNCSGTITNGGSNIDSGTTCGWGAASGSMSNTNPNLGTLGNNGGSTQTFPLLTGSPAINAGNDAICAAAPVNNTSQNGVTRPQGAHCEVGSYELKVYKLFLPFILR